MIKAAGAGRAALLTVIFLCLIVLGFAQDSSGRGLDRLPTAADWPIKHLDRSGSKQVELRFSFPGATGPWTSAIADINGDGIDDLIIGLPWASPYGNRAAGLVYVLFGSEEGFDSTIDLDRLAPGQGMRIAGQNPGDHFGWSLAAAGDFNGNGTSDLVIGAPGAGQGGRVYVIFGAAQGRQLPQFLNPALLNGNNGLVIEGAPDSGNLGHAVTGLGDFNGNGFADLAFSSPEANPHGHESAGRVHVLFGGDHSFKARLRAKELIGNAGLTINGERGDQRLGMTLTGIGDFNANGFADLAFNATDGAIGEVLLLWGGGDAPKVAIGINRLRPEQHLILRSPRAGDGFGHSLAAMGDLDRDGHTEVLIGAPFSSRSGLVHSGAVYLLFGDQTPAAGFETATALQMIPVLFGTNDDEQLGAQLTSTGSLPKSRPGNGLISSRHSASRARQVNLLLHGRQTGLEFRRLQHSQVVNSMRLSGPLPSGHRLLFDQATRTDPSKSETSRSWQTAGVGNLVGPDRSTLVSGPLVEPGEVTPPLTIEGLFITFSEISDQIALSGDVLTIPFDVFEEPFNPQDIIVTASTTPEPIGDNNLSLTNFGGGAYELEVSVPPGLPAGSSTVELSAFNDISGGGGSTSFDILVYDPLPPILNDGAPLPDFFAFAGATLLIDFSVLDPQFLSEDISVLATALPLPAVDTIDILGTGATRTLSITTLPDETGTTTITLAAENPIGFTDELNFDLTVEPPPVDPDITPIDNQLGILGETVSVFFQVSKVGVNPDDLVVFAEADENVQIIGPDDLFLDYLGNGNYRLDIIIPENTNTGLTLIYVEVFDTNDFTFDFVYFELIVYAPLAPILNDGEPIPDQTVTAGFLLVVDFTVTDPQFDVEAVVVEGTHAGGVDFDFINIAGTGVDRQVVLQPNEATSGTSTIVLTAVNPIDETSDLSFVLNVEPADLRPLINGGEGIADQTVLAGQLLEIPFEVSDPSENPLFLEVTAVSLTPDLLPDEALVLSGDRELRLLSIQTLDQVAGIAQVRVEVINTQNWSSTSIFNINIQSNRTPLINDGDGIEDREVSAGDREIVDFTARDPINPDEELTVAVRSRNPDLIDDDALILINVGEGNWRLEIDVPVDISGPVEIEIRAFNSQGDETEAVFVLDVNEAPSRPPQINGGEGIADQDVTAGELLTVEFAISDIQFDLDQILVEANSLNLDILSNEALTLESGEPGIWTLYITTSEEITGAVQIVVTATNSFMLSSEAEFTVTILDPPVPSDPPLINLGQGLDNQEVTAGELLVVVFPVTDANDEPDQIMVIAHSMDQDLLPDNAMSLSLDQDLWSLEIQAPQDSVGPVTVTVTATNSLGLSSEESFTVDILEPPPPPEPPKINSGDGIADREVTAGESLIVEFSVTDAQDEAAAIEVTAASSDQGILPDSALSLSGENGLWTLSIQAPADSVGPATIVVTATNSLGLSTDTFFIVEIVAPPLEPTALAVTATRLDVPAPLGAMFHVEISNTGQAQADNIVIAVSAPVDQQILGGFRVASSCRIDDQTVYCDQQLVHPIVCEMQADLLLCSTPMLAAGVTVPVAVQLSDAATVRFDILVDADNADPVELSVEEES